MFKKNRIFIQMASYRDPQLIPTLKNCIEMSKYPQNLVFSIAWQHSPEDEWDNLDEFKDDHRFKIMDFNYTESKGACWARNQLQSQYNGEEYTLQLDSHHRFTQDWDEQLIVELKKLQEKGFKKPLITGYIPSFEPDNDPESRLMIPWKMNFDRFSPEGVIHFLPASIDNFKELTEPVPARFYSAHFCFTLGQFAIEVPHDPEYYFHGEEISIGVRAYTWGYDLFHLHKVVIWHQYTRKGYIKQWDDDKEWVKRNDHCYSRNRKLFGMEEMGEGEDLGRYGFGKIRPLSDYEKYAGISFKKRGIQQYTLQNNLAPNPTIDDPIEYENSFSIVFKHCIDIGFHQVPHNDYIFWAVAFEDENGVELYRKDADKNEILSMKNDPDGYCKVWRTFETTTRPYKWIVWPQSENHGWSDKIEGTLYEKKDNNG